MVAHTQPAPAPERERAKNVSGEKRLEHREGREGKGSVYGELAEGPDNEAP